MRLAAFCVLPALISAVPPLGWPTGSVKHRYYDTPKGQLHYVVSGDVSLSSQRPMLLLHSHPRSTTEFRYFAQDMSPKIPFIAIDWFGMGYSDDYKGFNSKDAFCTFEAMGSYALEIAAEERMSKFVVVGHMKGAHPAIELAYQAGERMVTQIVLLNPLILSPTAKAFIDSKLVPMLQAQALIADGSHLTAAWNDASAAPMGPSGTPWNNSRDLLGNQEKTNDELRCLNTGWQYDSAWTAYNEKNEPRMAAVDAYATSLFVYGLDYLADDAKYGLDPQFSFDAFGRALKHGHNSTRFLKGAGQGMLIQNSTIIANMVADFIHKAPPVRTMV